MFSKNELKLAYGIAIYLLLVGVLCYAALPPEVPDPPVRLMFDVTAGKVLFDHNTHAAETGYGVACYDCHHHPADDETALRACGDCHLPSSAEEKISSTCLDCHEPDEIEDTQMMNKADAFHAQCIDCHLQFEAGPVECSGCHVM